MRSLRPETARIASRLGPTAQAPQPTPARAVASRLLASVLGAGLLAGCASGGGEVQRVSNPLIPAPAAGTAWQVKAAGGGQTYGETSSDAAPWISVGPDGTIQARIPPSAATQEAAGAVQQGTVGSLQIHRAP